MVKNNIKSISTVLDKLIHDMNLQDSYYFYLLKDRWVEIVGKTLAVNSQPVALENKKLRLEVKDEHWRKEFKTHKKEILKKVTTFLKDKTEINDITFI